MLKKSIVFFAVWFVVSGAYAADAYASPSIRQLGTSVSSNTEKPVAALPSLPKATTEVVRAVKPQTDKDNEDPSRFPSIGSIKTISSARIKQPATSATISGGSAQPVVSGVTEAAFNEVVGRVQALETEGQKAISGVTESGSGNYVSRVSFDSDNNKLTVEKSHLLYAPVRNEGSSAIVSDAEIWLIR